MITNKNIKIKIIEYIKKHNKLYNPDILTNLDFNKTIFITKPEDFDTLNLPAATPIAFRCVTCGEYPYFSTSYRRNNLDRYKSMQCFMCYRAQRNIEKYGTDNPMKNKNIVAKGRDTWNNKSQEELTDIYRRSGETRKNKTPEQKKAIVDKIKQTKKENYGDENYNNREKFEQTMMDKYGVKRPIQNKMSFNKMCKTKQNKYGDPYFNNLTKRYETCQERYGYNNACESPEIIKKINEATMTKLGVKRPLQDSKYLDKMQNKMLERYGAKTTMESPELRKQVEQTNLDKYGSKCVFGNQDIREKSRSTMLETTGHDHPISSKINYYGVFLDSKWELAVWIYAKDHNEIIIREPLYYVYEYNGVVHRVYPDFYYMGQIIEVKGDHLFDENSAFKNQDREKNRAKYDTEINNGVVFWFEEECYKFIKYVEDTYGKTYMNLFYANNQFNPTYFGRDGYRIIQKPYFSIPIDYTPLAPKGISPFEMNKEDDYTVAISDNFPINFKQETF